MDETGIFQGVGTNGLVVGQSELKSTIKKHPGSQHWTTISEVLSATGEWLNPLVIFKASSKGWTSDEIGLE